MMIQPSNADPKSCSEWVKSSEKGTLPNDQDNGRLFAAFQVYFEHCTSVSDDQNNASPEIGLRSFLTLEETLDVTSTCKTLAVLRSKKKLWQKICIAKLNIESIEELSRTFFCFSRESPYKLLCPIETSLTDLEITDQVFDLVVSAEKTLLDRVHSLAVVPDDGIEHNWFVACTKLSHLKKLHFVGSKLYKETLVDESILDFVENLETLDLNYTQMSTSLAEVVGKKDLSKLKELYLMNSCIGVRPLTALFQFSSASRLEKLYLTSCCLQSDAIPILLKAQLLSLKELYLGFNNIGDEGVVELVGSYLGNQLEVLSLLGNKFGLEGFNALKEASLKSLTELNLGHIPLSLEQVRLLVRASCISRLQKLDLSFCRLGPHEASGMIDAKYSNLKVLILSGNDLFSQGLSSIIKAKFRCLKELRLCSNCIDDAGIQALVKSKVFESLESISLSYNLVGLAGMQALSNANLSHIKVLDLQKNQIDDSAISWLVQVKLCSIEELDLTRNDISSNGLMMLRKAGFSDEVLRI